MTIHEIVKYPYELLQRNYRIMKFYIVELKPSLTLSVLLHVTLSVFWLTYSSPISLNRFINSSEKIVTIDLVQVGNITNVKMARDTGKKSYPKDLEAVKPKESKQKVVSEVGESLPVMQNVNTMKRKPFESESVIKEQGSSNVLQAAFKSIKQEEKEMKINIDEKKEEGVLGKGKPPVSKLKPQTIDLSDSIRSQFVYCWSVPYGARNADNMRVKVDVDLDPKGKVISAHIVDIKQYDKNPFFRAMADSALRAVYKCSPLQGLPEGKYNLWKNMELVFDPKDMLS